MHKKREFDQASRATLSALLAAAFAATPAMADTLPLGDGKISTSPRAGYLFSCQTTFNSNAGAHASGDWLDEAAGTWDPDKKPTVDGSVTWAGEISIAVEGNQRVVRANGLPNHPTGIYPVGRSDDAYQYDRNPNTIQAGDVLLQLPATPQKAAGPSCVPMGAIGFTLTGAKVFNALDARGEDAPAREIQDACDGHPEQTGEYHYHSLTRCAADNKSGPSGHSDLLGYALDGFGMFGMYDAGGTMLRSGDLDECHGHTGPVAWDGKTVEIYHYHFTEDYPYTIGCFVGSPKASSGSGSGGQQQAQPQQPPQQGQQQPPGRRDPPPKKR